MANLPQWFSGVLHWLIAKVQKLMGTAPAPQNPTTTQTLGISPVAIDSKAYATVVIPALNEAKRIAEVVSYALADPATAEVIVVG